MPLFILHPSSFRWLLVHVGIEVRTARQPERAAIAGRLDEHAAVGVGHQLPANLMGLLEPFRSQDGALLQAVPFHVVFHHVVHLLPGLFHRLPAVLAGGAARPALFPLDRASRRPAAAGGPFPACVVPGPRPGPRLNGVGPGCRDTNRPPSLLPRRHLPHRRQPGRCQHHRPPLQTVHVPPRPAQQVEHQQHARQFARRRSPPRARRARGAACGRPGRGEPVAGQGQAEWLRRSLRRCGSRWASSAGIKGSGVSALWDRGRAKGKVGSRTMGRRKNQGVSESSSHSPLELSSPLAGDLHAMRLAEPRP